MSPARQARLAWRNIRDNRLRSGLTVLGLVIGIASVIILVGIGNGAANSVQSQVAVLLGASFAPGVKMVILAITVSVAVWTNGRRIAFACLCLLVMIPAALAYAGGGLLSGFPSSATVGDSITWKVDPGDEEGDLKVSASGASVSVNGNSFTVTFNKAGTVTIKASIGGTSDSCSVTVKEKETSGGDDPDTGDVRVYRIYVDVK